MLDAFIIEELRRREEKERGHTQQPRLELPVDDQRPMRPHPRDEDRPGRTPDRGVIIIDFAGE